MATVKNQYLHLKDEFWPKMDLWLSLIIAIHENRTGSNDYNAKTDDSVDDLVFKGRIYVFN